MISGDETAVIAVDGAEKSFGAVRALDGVSFSVRPHECVGLVGHNGAGKSTLVNLITGGLAPDSGSVLVSGMAEGEKFSIAGARAHGVRCVFQELSLCPNLTVEENTRITHPALKGLGWRRRARALIAGKLDAIFPGHGIDCTRMIGDLSIAERQMVEIATAFSESDTRVRLVILDEPTSSLDAGLAAQLLGYVRKFVSEGGAVVIISHILGEILSTADRVVVMKDGRVVSERRAAEFTVETLVGAMGSVVRARDARAPSAAAGEIVLTRKAPAGSGGIDFVARRGELVGLAGLGGHGQTRMLVGLFNAGGGDWVSPKDPRIAFVAGDRHVDGNLPLWSILRNMTISLLPDLTRRGLVDTRAEAEIAARWRERIEVRTKDMANPILSLSGGNQQKVLFARALATRAPVVLMDDPMRGVDIGTKQEVYAMLREEAAKGRTFVWYSTEMDEICQCDRVYVFREGRIVAELAGAEVSEERILSASFAEAAA
ncbi:sugar ABC transporter ATP-binding protein [Arsenicitalea aurantiaca]|uniref:Sugar ABC transporter ATP-binding protein n=1 Tax=Arsenicitalea aurantiaca TaxID=1783274 RepID=A0A433XK02_9HYPH|nr:sugar ABC transporter ATP-binding protein [Arsenicitalea aurantiaca]RUT34422.1 sugar ABC transporter ATP-binding protein [Arsenicitalea aurantiaca]